MHNVSNKIYSRNEIIFQYTSVQIRVHSHWSDFCIRSYFTSNILKISNHIIKADSYWSDFTSDPIFVSDGTIKISNHVKLPAHSNPAQKSDWMKKSVSVWIKFGIVRNIIASTTRWLFCKYRGYIHRLYNLVYF